MLANKTTPAMDNLSVASNPLLPRPSITGVSTIVAKLVAVATVNL